MMNWAYVAGFFDGEGCLHLHVGRRNETSFSWRLLIAQTKPEVLHHIQDFLMLQGIASKVVRHRLGHHQLVIGKRPLVAAFLRGVMPYLVVKKTLAQDTLRFTTIFPKRPPWLGHPRGSHAPRYLQN